MGSSTEMDLGGLTLVTKNIKVGATAPGQAGTDISTTELGYIDAVVAGTVTASKALVVDSSKAIGELGTVTMADAANLVFNATTGTKLGTTATQKLAFYGAVPVVQPSVL